jgi:hypothetical protein
MRQLGLGERLIQAATADASAELGEDGFVG